MALKVQKLLRQRFPQRSKWGLAMAATETEQVNRGVLPSPVAVAHITKAYGTSGEVVVKLTHYFNEERPVFIYSDGLPVPFFIESITKRGNNGAILKFTTVKSHKGALALVNKELFLSASSIPNETPGKREEILPIISGATVIDSGGEVVGHVTEYLEYPENPCIEVKLAGELEYALAEGNEDSIAVIPFNDGLILDVDSRCRSIKMKIPKGLIKRRE